MAFQLVSLLNRGLSRDWNQQELAEFYRVESVLGAAGIAVDMDRGVSDEGDPWFAFCRPENGDVIIHFARYDGFYIAASGALGQVLRGRDFRELVDAFIARQPLVMPGHKQDNKVILHPSTLLTALVATALFLLEHQKANASDLLQDVAIDADSKSFDGHSDNKFAALIKILVEPLRPHEQRDALFAIGAIVAGITALSFDAAKDSPSLTPALEETVAQQDQENKEIEEDRLLQLSQEPSRKVAQGDDAPIVQNTASDEKIIVPTQIIVGELSPHETKDHLNLELNLRQTSIEPTAKLALAPTFDSDNTLLTLALDGRMPHDNVNSSRASQGTHENKSGLSIAHLESTSSAADVASTITIGADKADFNLQDSIAASLTKNFGSGSFVHLNLADIRSVPHLTSFELTKLISSSLYSSAISTKIEGTPSTLGTISASSNNTALSEEVQTKKYSPIEEKAMGAISFFAKTNPDFKITQLGKDIILFDFDARPDNKIVYDVHSWDLPDGSKITIIGALPDHFQV